MMRLFIAVVLSLVCMTESALMAQGGDKENGAGADQGNVTSLRSRDVPRTPSSKRKTRSFEEDKENKGCSPKSPEILPSSESPIKDIAAVVTPKPIAPLGEYNPPATPRKPQANRTRLDLLQESPESKFKRESRGVRADIVRARRDIADTRKALSFDQVLPEIDPSTTLRKIWSQFPDDYFTHTGEFEGMSYGFDVNLFNLDQIVLYRDSSDEIIKFTTNRQRMSEGLAPITYKCADVLERFFRLENPEALFEQQRLNTVVFHHTAQDDKSRGILIPHHLHHGTKAGLVIKGDDVIAFDISKEEARERGLLKKGGRFCADHFHINSQKSTIDRGAFKRQRHRLWQYVVTLLDAS